ncbi:MAG: hypothetical protein Q8K75_10720 [Chlamydiales bacterium]|nr:hypothetical protein [Chlamydiales bacterium]
MDGLNSNSINDDILFDKLPEFVDKLPEFDSLDTAFEFLQNNPPDSHEVQNEIRGNVDTLRDKATAKIDEKFGDRFSSIKGKLPFGGSPKKLGSFLLDGLARGIIKSKILEKSSEFFKEAEIFFDKEGGTQRQAARAAARPEEQGVARDAARPEDQELAVPPQPPAPPPKPRNPPVMAGQPPFQPMVVPQRPMPAPPGAQQGAGAVQSRQPPPAPPPRPAVFPPSAAQRQPPPRPAQFDRPLPPIPQKEPQPIAENPNPVPSEDSPPNEEQYARFIHDTYFDIVESEPEIPMADVREEVVVDEELPINEESLPNTEAPPAPIFSGPPPPPPPPAGPIKGGWIPSSVQEPEKFKGTSPELVKAKERENDPTIAQNMNVIREGLKSIFPVPMSENPDDDDVEEIDDGYWDTPDVSDTPVK